MSSDTPEEQPLPVNMPFERVPQHTHQIQEWVPCRYRRHVPMRN
jgi:hypothetical protein